MHCGLNCRWLFTKVWAVLSNSFHFIFLSTWYWLRCAIRRCFWVLCCRKGPTATQTQVIYFVWVFNYTRHVWKQVLKKKIIGIINGTNLSTTLRVCVNIKTETTQYPNAPFKIFKDFSTQKYDTYCSHICSVICQKTIPKSHAQVPNSPTLETPFFGDPRRAYETPEAALLTAVNSWIIPIWRVFSGRQNAIGSATSPWPSAACEMNVAKVEGKEM